VRRQTKRGAITPYAPRLAWALISALSLLLAGCGKTDQLYKQQSYVFGTLVEVSVYGVSEKKAKAATSEVLREFDRLHQAFHAWKPSPLRELNQAIANGEAKKVSPELAAAIRDAAQWSRASNDLFNPAIGQLIQHWGFQSDQFRPVHADTALIASLLRGHPLMSDLSVSPDNVVTTTNRMVQLDFGGYAKGLALDIAAKKLRAAGIESALVNIGGNLIAIGKHGERPWHIGVQHPREPRAIVELDLQDGEAIGTSGDYQRFFELDGKRYCHIIDPRSGWPATGTQAITVLAPPGPHAGVISDVASKPAFIAGAGWQATLAPFGVLAAMRVDETGKMDLTPAMQQRARPIQK
jgi:FAD:protein FMN transferase